ncbi:Ulp1 family isopeptidase [Bradyrhizobium sp. TZ2]
MLGAKEWLADQHIEADYKLLERELQRDNPDLAARTRLVWPAQAHLLRLTDDEIDLLVQGIVTDDHGNDTADFLFVPVNNGGAGLEDGSHWSLLLVDRREPEGMVAHHYDSSKKQSNKTCANQLAERLGAKLKTASMAIQRNGWDCGVFVVDATRALVGRFAEGRRPEDELLHLGNLVADRQALRDRLRGIRLCDAELGTRLC